MKSTVVDISYADDLIVPVEEDMRDSIPSDPLFVMELLHEAEKSDWQVALDMWFTKNGRPPGIELKALQTNA